jgi:NAD(P)-dependent dehydrogenase (short-subunit alcohol dehydrogenase family)
VHAAGILRPGSLGELDTAQGEAMWRLHVQAATQIANTLLPAMVQARRGRLVLVGSRVARGVAGRSQYAASKAALIALARSWAAEVIAAGVTVNVVSPAATDTGMLKDPARRGTPSRLPPIGRLIQPDEVASLVAYLLSPAAAAITAQDIQICGGSSVL